MFLTNFMLNQFSWKYTYEYIILLMLHAINFIIYWSYIHPKILLRILLFFQGQHLYAMIFIFMLWTYWQLFCFVLIFKMFRKFFLSLQIIAFDELKTDYKNPIDQCNSLNPVSMINRLWMSKLLTLSRRVTHKCVVEDLNMLIISLCI